MKIVRVSRNLRSPFQRLLSWVFTDQPCRKVNIAALPNDVLLDIFYFYLDLPQHNRPFSNVGNSSRDTWRTLVHVCQRWRYVVFGSPGWLNLRLRCTNRTPARKMLDIWPTLPIVISCHRRPSSPLRGILNIIAALKCHDRVCEISIWDIPNSLLKRYEAMKNPFPALTSLQLSSADDRCQPVLPDSFLGGFAPRLRSLDLHGIAFPAPQKLLLSATDLVTLRLERIPHSGYISPEEIVACLSTLTKLKELALEFQAALSIWHPTSQHPPPLTRSVLPALTSLRFRGASEYLEYLLSRTDLPLLDNVDITFYYWPHTSDFPLLCELVSRNESFEALGRADIAFGKDFVNVALSRSRELTDHRTLKFWALYSNFDRQLLYLSRFCNLVLPRLSNLEHLYIHSSFPLPYIQYYIPNTRWLELLHPFTSVENLHLSENTALLVASALRQLSTSGEGVAEVLPALRNVFLPDPQPSEKILAIIGQFVAAIQPSGRSVSVRY